MQNAPLPGCKDELVRGGRPPFELPTLPEGSDPRSSSAADSPYAESSCSDARRLSATPRTAARGSRLSSHAVLVDLADSSDSDFEDDCSVGSFDGGSPMRSPAGATPAATAFSGAHSVATSFRSALSADEWLTSLDRSARRPSADAETPGSRRPVPAAGGPVTPESAGRPLGPMDMDAVSPLEGAAAGVAGSELGTPASPSLGGAGTLNGETPQGAAAKLRRSVSIGLSTLGEPMTGTSPSSAASVHDEKSSGSGPVETVVEPMGVVPGADLKDLDLVEGLGESEPLESVVCSEQLTALVRFAQLDDEVRVEAWRRYGGGAVLGLAVWLAAVADASA